MLPTQEICGSNPIISKFYLPIVLLNRKDENKEKEARNGPSFEVIVSCSPPIFSKTSAERPLNNLMVVGLGVEIN